MADTNPALAKPFAVASKNNTARYNFTQFVCNTENDIAVVPTTVAPGSTLFCIESSNTYMLNTNREWVKISVNNAGDSGGYSEIIIDWDAMTCNYSASEIREASAEGKPFIGKYGFESFDEKNNTATIIEWEPDYGNNKYEYIVHEDKTVEEILPFGRLLNDMPLRVSMSQQGYVTYTANELHEEYYDADLHNFPLIYLYDDDGNVYHLAYYQGKIGATDAVMRFVCVTSTSIKYAELSGDNTQAHITEKAI